MKKISLHCAPLSVNAAWQGRRYKTDDYLLYEREVSALIPNEFRNIELCGALQVTYRFYLKHHKTTDYDNLIKPLQDILCKNGVMKDDRQIYRAIIEKHASKENRIEIEIETLEI